MPIIFYSIAFTLLLISIRFNKGDTFLDKQSSNSIKGFFILLIVFSHIINAFHYEGFLSSQLQIFRSIIGNLITSMFFFISGYGILYSTDKGGIKYARSIISNRIIRIILYTIIGLVPYYIYAACMGYEHPVSDYFLSFIGLASFGNETWFLFAILICYALCAVVLFFFYKKKVLSVVLISLGIVTYILVMYFNKEPDYKWNTIISFIFGLLAYLFKEKINSLLSSKYLVPAISIISLVIIIPLQYLQNIKCPETFPEIYEMLFANMFFCILFTCLTKAFTFKSPILGYLGNASFAIFLMHRLVICCFKEVGTIPNEHLNYIVLFITAVGIGIPVYYIYKIVDKYLTNHIVAWNRELISDSNK